MTGPALPKLHRAYNGWAIEGTELIVSALRVERGWTITASHGARGVACRRWLAAAGLRDAQFSTREQALRAFAAADALDRAPRNDRMKFRRRADGTYVSSDGRYVIRPGQRRGKWQAVRVPRKTWHHEMVVAFGQSLPEVMFQVEQLQPNLPKPSPSVALR